MTIQELNGNTKETLRLNVEDIRSKIEETKNKCGDLRDVTFLAATKTVPAEVINYVTQELGVKDIGENRS